MSARSVRTLAVAGIAAVLGGGILGTAQPAGAVTGLVTPQLTTVNNSTAEKVQTVFCPAGTRAIGGSAVVGGSTKVRINTETLDPSGFTVLAREPRGGVSEPWYVVVTAQCAPAGSLPGLEYRRADSAYTSTLTHSATAVCSPGKKVIGVGGLIDSNGAGQDRLVLTTIRPGTDLAGVVVAGSEDEAGYSGNWRALGGGGLRQPGRTAARCRSVDAGLDSIEAGVGGLPVRDPDPQWRVRPRQRPWPGESADVVPRLRRTRFRPTRIRGPGPRGPVWFLQ